MPKLPCCYLLPKAREAFMLKCLALVYVLCSKASAHAYHMYKENFMPTALIKGSHPSWVN